MYCTQHPLIQASALCCYCGAGLCAACISRTPSGRIVCTPECAQALTEAEALLMSIRRKTLSGYQFTGYFCFGAGVLLLIFSVLTGYNQQWDVLALQLPIAAGLVSSGVFYLRLANRQ